ncbi:MAG: polyprenyl synthetase family protein [Gemmatimonadetes bacterium]|nr:MAG: polyprenyl synthetase family protein [Gemmatimonadota bacterium]
MRLQNLILPIQNDLNQVENELKTSINSDIPVLQDIGHHLWQVPGKRLRPIMLLLTARLFPHLKPERITAAVAVEMVHTATLIHDDCIDVADTRRGQPTVFARWGTQTAILTGDYIYAAVIKMLIEQSLYDVLDTIARAMMIVTSGEVNQISHNFDFESTEDSYYQYIYDKTAVLIEATCRIGAMVGGASPEQVAQMAEFGKTLGIAFQIVDDLLDYIGDPEQTGKPVGIDLMEGKVTLPLIHALRQAPAAEREAILPILRQHRESPARWDSIIDFVTRHGGLDYARSQVNFYAKQAKAILKQYQVSPVRTTLMTAVDYVVARNR